MSDDTEEMVALPNGELVPRQFYGLALNEYKRELRKQEESKEE